MSKLKFLNIREYLEISMFNIRKVNYCWNLLHVRSHINHHLFVSQNDNIGCMLQESLTALRSRRVDLSLVLIAFYVNCELISHEYDLYRYSIVDKPKFVAISDKQNTCITIKETNSIYDFQDGGSVSCFGHWINTNFPSSSCHCVVINTN